MPEILVNDGSGLNQVNELYVKDGGAWHLLSQAYVKAGGVWTLVYPSSGSVSYSSPGSYSFRVGGGVYQLNVSVVKGGDGGGGGLPLGAALSGGAGSAGGYVTNQTIAVTPGEYLTIVCGGGGLPGICSVLAFTGGNSPNSGTYDGTGGGTSGIYRAGSPLVSAGGGSAGLSNTGKSTATIGYTPSVGSGGSGNGYPTITKLSTQVVQLSPGNSTWTVPLNVYEATFEICGGAGGGGGADAGDKNDHIYGSGGGASNMVSSGLKPVVYNASYSIHIGSGGGGNASNTDHNYSSGLTGGQSTLSGTGVSLVANGAGGGESRGGSPGYGANGGPAGGQGGGSRNKLGRGYGGISTNGGANGGDGSPGNHWSDGLAGQSGRGTIRYTPQIVNGGSWFPTGGSGGVVSFSW